MLPAPRYCSCCSRYFLVALDGEAGVAGVAGVAVAALSDLASTFVSAFASAFFAFLSAFTSAFTSALAAPFASPLGACANAALVPIAKMPAEIRVMSLFKGFFPVIE